VGCEKLLTSPAGMEYSPHVALTSGEDNASALEGSTPVRAYKKELRAALFLFSATSTQSSITCSDQIPDLTRRILNTCPHELQTG
jgi:hypothetical protein